MKINRIDNNIIHGYDYELIEDNKKLKIIYAGNLDLYYILQFDDEIPYGEKASKTFDITKDNYELYKLFDELYNNIINGMIWEDEKRIKQSSIYKDLVDKNKNICWISDEGQRELEDSLTISKEKDKIHLSFERNNQEDYPFKSAFSIGIRICNSGSRYDRFNIPFMRMFQKLQTIDPNYHQIDIEELLYQKRKDKN